ncbi:FecCD family ABC transporter permease [Spiribacter halobius]|uniref:Iron ABC transporter permease n=1 Tax=Sediminicurvatus halobius TaxID=2182432 RepID=A0A2U2N243_9GAMM|nr:iron ABC transporter permease [Spiribacter halobius]PWG63133.1 iron ABC transporter permease [Spiribacter halobius]UEX77583.1 iron ABC transporter permease [Spiribacter halobius]
MTVAAISGAAPLPRRHRRRALILLGLAGAAGTAVLLSLRIGSVPLDTATVLAALMAPDNSDAHAIVRELRLPRTVLGAAVGAALAVAGAIMQAVTRNPLASPTILGLNAGAIFAVVCAVFVLGIADPAQYLWFAFLGALGAAALVFAIGSAGRGGATPVKLALAGTVVTALLSSWVSGILIFDQRTLDEARFWLAGSLGGRDLEAFFRVAPLMAAGIATGLALGHSLNALGLGRDVATALGQRTAWLRVIATATVVLLAGSAVAVAGPIGFVGLAVPHMVRGLLGPDYRWVLPGCAVGGAALLLTADVIGRVIARPGEVEAGIITALVGAPVLIHIVRRPRLTGL